jgi:putative hydrolase of the HAD superfamily
LPKAILLDLDDTILADDSITEKAWQAACNRFSSLVGGIKADELYAAIAEAARNYWADPEQHRRGRLDLIQARREVVSLAFIRLGLQAHQVAIELADSYSAEKERLIFPRPGSIETLRILKEKGLRLALLTNGGSTLQRKKIDRFGLETYFDAIFIESEFGAGKPEERVFRAALKKLDVTAVEAWMVGDDLARDIVGAQKVGIFSIWLDWKGKGLPDSTWIKPDRIISSLSELIPVA